jgi:hypothetical protein
MTARVRIGDADRDRLVAELREHFTAGRLSMDELDRRLGVVLAAVYADEAAAVFTDLPSGGSIAAPLDGTPVPVGDPAGSPAGSPANTGRSWLGRGRHGQSTTPGDGWVPTAERFRDPSSGKIMRVWIDPADQSRHYVPDAQ